MNLPFHTLHRTAALLAFAAASTLPCVAKDSEPTFVPWSYTGPDLFPSAIVSSASVDWNGDVQEAEDQRTGRDPDPSGFNLPLYGDENGWLGVELQSLTKGSEVEVTVSVDGVLTAGRWSGRITKVTPSGRARVQPKASWDYSALLQVRQQKPVNVTYSVSINGNKLPDKVLTYQMKSLNDCVLGVSHDANFKNYDHLHHLFAGYVNENHPYVDKILQEALTLRLVSNFCGYQEDEQAVYDQVFAIWNVLQRHGIHYSSITQTTPSTRAHSQTVRFLDQSVDAQQANCVDGTVLFASILTKIGIDVELVLIPGHCFLAFDPVGKGTKRKALETTLIGEEDLTPMNRLGTLTAEEYQAELKASLHNFAAALKTGQETLRQNARFIAAKQPKFCLIPMAEARAMKVMPLPYSGDK